MIDSQTSPKMAALVAARLLFAFAQTHVGFDSPFARDLGAAFLANEAGEAAGKLPFLSLGKGHIQHFGNRETENPVAKKFEPLISLAPAARHRAHVSERGRNEICDRQNDVRCDPRVL